MSWNVVGLVLPVFDLQSNLEAFRKDKGMIGNVSFSTSMNMLAIDDDLSSLPLASVLFVNAVNKSTSESLETCHISHVDPQSSSNPTADRLKPPNYVYNLLQPRLRYHKTIQLIKSCRWRLTSILSSLVGHDRFSSQAMRISYHQFHGNWLQTSKRRYKGHSKGARNNDKAVEVDRD